MSFQNRVARVEELVQKVESAADPAVRRTARELVETLMEMHGAAFERILEIVGKTGQGGASVIADLAVDPLVSSLLVLYGMHPDDFETRVHRALDKARPLLRRQGVRIDTVAIHEAAVHVKLIGVDNGQMERVVREALLETAPDAADISIEGSGSHPSGFVPLSSLLTATGASRT